MLTSIPVSCRCGVLSGEARLEHQNLVMAPGKSLSVNRYGLAWLGLGKEHIRCNCCLTLVRDEHGTPVISPEHFTLSVTDNMWSVVVCTPSDTGTQPSSSAAVTIPQQLLRD